MTDTETLSKLFLELAHVVPSGTKTFREMALEKEIERLRSILAEIRAFAGEGTFSRQEVLDYVDRALEERDHD